MNCADCRYSEPKVTLDESDVVLLCRRYPPNVINVDSETDYVAWPTVHDTEWCGEYEPPGDNQ